MKFYIDTVIEEKIEKCVSTNLIDGITTTPTFFIRDKVNPHDFYLRMYEKYPALDLQVELMGDSVNEMQDNLGQLLSLKIPTLTFKTPISLVACSFISANRDKKFNVHLVYNVIQALFAAKSGAKFICPLLGRFDDNGYDGVELYAMIKNALVQNGFLDVNVMASSIRTTNHLSRVFKAGKVDVVTFPPDIFLKSINNLITDDGVRIFKNDLNYKKE